ncbi:dihydroneopterin aldolase [Planctomycetota bacterium]
MSDTLDQIFIRDLEFRCIIGINSDERREKQDVVTHVTLWADLSAACRSDNIEDTVDYKAIKKSILKMAETSQFFLVEALAQSMADICLQNERVQQARIKVEKPTALRFARSVGVDITRRK